ncbi:hypothetical protein, partial [Sphingobacterium populi]|uniref:hypothetical protein n=1 Tax=Sphingobacterium sp. CFCC 11742 TaxID=1775560 RepID=UPI0018D2C422
MTKFFARDFLVQFSPFIFKVGVNSSRGVTINSLRKALSTVEGIEIVYEHGHYRVVIDHPCYCDYAVLQTHIAKNKDL